MSDDGSVETLVALARNGEQAAWNRIVERYGPLVWGMCRRHGLTGADIDDVGASVWLRLVEHLDTIREPAALPGWLATTTRHECLRLLRTRSRHVLIADDDGIVDDTEPAADAWLLVEERHVALRAAFAELPQRCQDLLSMLFADPPMPYTRISTITGMAVGAIGPNRMRCLERLRRHAELAALLDRPPVASDHSSGNIGSG